MKTFEIITESDARVLERGETVMLAKGGHINVHVGDARERRTHQAVHFVHRASELWNGQSGHGPDLRRDNHPVRPGVHRL